MRPDRSTPVELVWFKRDLRVRDHAALTAAVERGREAGRKTVGLYVFEPEVCRAQEFDGQHLSYLLDALGELSESLAKRGIPLLLRTGAMPEVLRELRREVPFARLWSHEETGLLATFARDLRVAEWARGASIPWTELPQTGVVRRLRTRDGWARLWSQRMEAPPAEVRGRGLGPAWLVPDPVPQADDPRCEVWGVRPALRVDQSRGGERAARKVLSSFLDKRGSGYTPAMSSPGPARTGCSRLSEHLAFGTVSMRSVWQATSERLSELYAAEPDADTKRWRRSLNAFAQRLHWHCHFMQKLEDKPDLEERNLHPGYDGLREAEFQDARLEAWKAGLTGYPMVDACMRSLVATGWLNFRMRAMLMSFASYHLWLHWRGTAPWLGAQFLDFEPGIHYAQAQMQSGVTGINTLRMYSPAKQAVDHDPEGSFIRHWVPELRAVPTLHLAEPHLMTRAEQVACGVQVGCDYPLPIVDHKEAIAHARARFAAVRRDPQVRAEAQRVLRKHGSRKRTHSRARKKDEPSLFDDGAQT